MMALRIKDVQTRTLKERGRESRKGGRERETKERGRDARERDRARTSTVRTVQLWPNSDHRLLGFKKPRY